MNKVNRQRPFGSEGKMVICNGRFRVQYEFCAEQLLMLFYTQYMGWI